MNITINNNRRSSSTGSLQHSMPFIFLDSSGFDAFARRLISQVEKSFMELLTPNPYFSSQVPFTYYITSKGWVGGVNICYNVLYGVGGGFDLRYITRQNFKSFTYLRHRDACFR